MKFRIINTLPALLILLNIIPLSHAMACTSAIISAEMNPYGRPLLWKHRDTSTTDNKVEYIPAKNGNHAFVALYNAKDKNLEEAWMGMNDVGFAIMNTASYNLKDDNVPNKKMDREGFVMSRALKTCKTVNDFAKLLETLPRPMGVEANFGVIDASGNGAFFETNNHSYRRYDLKDAENGVLIRTNFSYSGRKNQGYGYLREANARHLLQPYIQTSSVTPEVLTEIVSRTFYHDGKKKDFSGDESALVEDEDFIPRFKSTATIVIEGCRPISDIDRVKPGDLTEEYIMWTGLGYPPCAEIFAVRCMEEGVDSGLRGSTANGHSPVGDKAKARRDKAFLKKAGDKKRYIQISKLYNAGGTGFVQQLLPVNLETYRRERTRRDRERH